MIHVYFPGLNSAINIVVRCRRKRRRGQLKRTTNEYTSRGIKDNAKSTYGERNINIFLFFTFYPFSILIFGESSNAQNGIQDVQDVT